MDILSLSEPSASLKALTMMVFFIGVAYWAFRPKRRGRHHRDEPKE